MSNALNCYILDRATFAIKSNFQSYDWEANRDYLTNEKSYFVPATEYQAKHGDIFIAKDDSFGVVTKVIGGRQRTGFIPFYVGVIDSFEDMKIIACDIYNLMNFEFPATRKTGANLCADIVSMIGAKLLNDTSKIIGNLFIMSSTSGVNYSYQPSDPPTPTNFIDYLVGCFEKYNVIWDVALIEQDGNALNIYTEVKQVQDLISIKNNSVNFVDWEVYINPAGIGQHNKLLIVNKTTEDMMNPVILSTWYIQNDGGLTQSPNQNVYRPTKDKVYIYDATDENAPTYQEVARSELSASQYSHEITFGLVKKNNLVKFEQLKIGTLANIVFNGIIYNSVLTGYTINADSEIITLRFGHVRSTFQYALQSFFDTQSGGGITIGKAEDIAEGIAETVANNKIASLVSGFDAARINFTGTFTTAAANIYYDPPTNPSASMIARGSNLEISGKGIKVNGNGIVILMLESAIDCSVAAITFVGAAIYDNAGTSIALGNNWIPSNGNISNRSWNSRSSILYGVKGRTFYPRVATYTATGSITLQHLQLIAVYIG